MGASNAGISTLAVSPPQSTPPPPTAASTAPTTPPTSAWEELDGIPKSQVMRFHTMPPTSPPRTTSRVTTPASTIPLAIVAATASDKNAPTRLRLAERSTARRGLSARVAIDVAIALPVS